MMRAQWKNNKYQAYNLWLDPTVARTHNLPHSSQARYNRYTTDVIMTYWLAGS
jgi:hypothetical protein